MNALQKCLLTLLLVAGGVQAQERLEFWPDATYDSAVPTPAILPSRIKTTPFSMGSPATV